MADIPTAIKINCKTGEVTYRNLTADEIAAITK